MSLASHSPLSPLHASPQTSPLSKAMSHAMTKQLLTIAKTGTASLFMIGISLPVHASLCITTDGEKNCQANSYSTNSYSTAPSYSNTQYQSNQQVRQPQTFNPSQYQTTRNYQTYTSNSASSYNNSYSNASHNGASYSSSSNSNTGYTSYPSTTYSNNNYAYNNSSYSGSSFGGSSYSGSGANYFEEARRAASRGDSSALYQYEQQMRGTLFAMYPEYWRLANSLTSLSPSTVINFVNRYPNTVMAEKLIADYAEDKAQKGDYSAVQQVSNYIQNADASEACAIGIGDVHGNNRTRLAEQKAKVWLNTLKQPALCDQLGMELNHSNLISNEDRKQRLYRMLREGQTGQIMALSGRLGTSIGYSDLQQLQFSQNNFLTNFANQPYSEKNQYLYLYAIGRIAKKSYREAITQLEYDIRQDNMRGQRLLSEPTRQMAYRTIAVKRMNMNTDDGFSNEAVQWFRKSWGQPFNYEEAEDYAQAGIRFNQWQDVINAIASMDANHQTETKWQYWLGRAYEQTGDRSKATGIYRNVATNNNYYGFLAKDKVGQSVSLSQMGGGSMPNISSSQRASMLNDPSFARAFALYSVNKSYARREWNWGVNQAIKNNNRDLLIAAARHAHDLGWYDRSIYAMEKANEELGSSNAALSHPMPMQGSVVSYSQRAGIDPAWAYGIMRQESRFNVNARSGVGASGLMQIMPATGRYIARNLGESYSSSRVNSGNTNIRYGTWYMGNILGKLGGQPVLATAGYNAGPSKAERWQPNFGNLAADQYVETIAYPETRNYVKRVMENATVYGHRLGRDQQITNRMGTVTPKY